MKEILPDILRGFAGNLGCIMIMSTMITAKKSKKSGWLALISILAISMGVDIGCYLYTSYEHLAVYNTILFTGLCFVVKPFFKENLGQWVVSFVTMENVGLSVVIISYIISRYMPSPAYSNAILRVILYIILYIVFRFFIQPIYRDYMHNWAAFLIVVLGICIGFISIFFSGEITKTFTVHKSVLLTLVGVAALAYFSMFHTLKVIGDEYKLREENDKIKASEELLMISADAMKKQIELMDSKVHQTRISQHDQRHFEAMLLELIKHRKVEEVENILEKKTVSSVPRERTYCKNTMINAVVTYYIALTEAENIRCDVALDIPQKTEIDSLGLSMAVSNLLENAIHGCRKVKNEERFIKLSASSGKQLLLSVENSCENNVQLDENGLPFTLNEEHGIGTKSIAAFVKSVEGEVFYDVSDDVFKVNIMI